MNPEARIEELEKALRDIQALILDSRGETDSYDGTANPVIAFICEKAVGKYPKQAG